MCDIKASIVHETRNDRPHSGGGSERPNSLPLRQYHVTKKEIMGDNTTEPSYGISIELFTRRKLGVGAYLLTWRHIWEDIYRL